MNDSNPENPVENAPETQPAVAPQFDARRRLRELLSVPERDRSDEQWDEIIELEIQLAPGNRISGSEPHSGGNQGRSHQQQHAGAIDTGYLAEEPAASCGSAAQAEVAPGRQGDQADGGRG